MSDDGGRAAPADPPDPPADAQGGCTRRSLNATRKDYERHVLRQGPGDRQVARPWPPGVVGNESATLTLESSRLRLETHSEPRLDRVLAVVAAASHSSMCA